MPLIKTTQKQINKFKKPPYLLIILEDTVAI